MAKRIDLPQHQCGKTDPKESVPPPPSHLRPWRDLFFGKGPLWVRLIAWSSRNLRR